MITSLVQDGGIVFFLQYILHMDFLGLEKLTMNIIGSLLAYIAENHSMVKKIDIRYSELVAATTPDSDVLMSGKDFNGPINVIASWRI